MKKITITLIGCVLAVSMLLTLCACSNTSNKAIEDLMTQFESACNSLDLDAVLNCVNPQISDKIKIGLGIVGMFTQTDTNELFEKLALALSSDDLGGSDFFSSIKIHIEQVAVDDDTATVNALLRYNVAGSPTQREATINCVYYAERWYISSFSVN